MKVEVYFNLHKKLFSVRSVATGRVMFHTYEVCIDNPKFVVRKAGRDKVLRERKKNVHAFVRGDIRHYSEILSPRLDLTSRELQPIQGWSLREQSHRRACIHSKLRFHADW